MNKILVAIILVLAVALAMVVTCPDKQAHQEAIINEVKAAVTAYIEDETKEDDKSDSEKRALANVVSDFGVLVASQLADYHLDANLEVDNYFVISVGTIEIDEKKTPVTIGAFGHIFVLFSEKMHKDYVAGGLG